jgi:hypothetical protein
LDLPGAGAGAEDGSFAAVIFCSRPRRDLLLCVKQYAKTLGPGPALLPKEIAMVLYLGAIAAARLRLGERISTLSDESLASGIKWALEQEWLDDASRALMSEASQMFELEEELEQGRRA